MGCYQRVTDRKREAARCQAECPASLRITNCWGLTCSEQYTSGRYVKLQLPIREHDSGHRFRIQRQEEEPLSKRTRTVSCGLQTSLQLPTRCTLRCKQRYEPTNANLARI